MLSVRAASAPEASEGYTKLKLRVSIFVIVIMQPPTGVEFFLPMPSKCMRTSVTIAVELSSPEQPDDSA